MKRILSTTLIITLFCLTNKSNNYTPKHTFAFCYLRIYKIPQKKLKLLDYKIIEGKIKYTPEKRNHETFLEIEVLKNDSSYEIYQIDNPLQLSIEQFNENGNISKKIIDLDSADFFLRLPIKENISIQEIKFYEITNKSNEKQKRYINSVYL